MPHLYLLYAGFICEALSAALAYTASRPELLDFACKLQ